MMQPAKDGNCRDIARCRGRRKSGAALSNDRRVRSCCNTKHSLQNTTPMRFAEHDYVVEAFVTYRFDEPLSARVLPRRAWRGSANHGSLLRECGGCMLDRMRSRGRESKDMVLRSRKKHQSPVPRSTRRISRRPSQLSASIR